MIKGTKGRRKPLGFGLYKNFVRTSRLGSLRGKCAAQDLIDLGFRQPSEEVRKERDLVALGDHYIHREIRAKPDGNRPQALLPIPAITLQALGV